MRRDGAPAVMLGRVRRDDDGAALVLVVLAMMVAATLSLLLLGLTISQGTPTAFDRKSVRAVHAAEAGLDAALARLRAARTTLASGEVEGDRTKLPCGPLSGQVGGAPGGLRYTVQLRYYVQDPAGRPQAWRDDPTNQVACGASGAASVPAYVLLRSAATGDAVPRRSATSGDRSLESIYDLRLLNVNVRGGLIRYNHEGSPFNQRFCIDAGSATPAAGTPLSLQECATGSTQQLWAWRTDFTIVMAASQGTGGTGGLCVTAAPAIGATRVATSLQPCTASPQQQWGYADSAAFRGNPVAGERWCLVLDQPGTFGTALVATREDQAGFPCAKAWLPDARVGAGSVGDVGDDVVDRQLQWVNYAEYGRCFDVTNWLPSRPSMISFPCKQDPTSRVGWNQTLIWDGASRQLYTRAWNPETTYNDALAASAARSCLTAPLALDAYVTMASCTAGQADQVWTVNRRTGVPATSYTVVDHRGRCLALGPRNVSYETYAEDDAKFAAQFSSIVVRTCDGGAAQKWNAPPDEVGGLSRDTRELGVAERAVP